MRQIKRLISLLCCLALMLSMIPAVSALSFPGLDNWAKEEVTAMDALGLIPGALDNTDLRNSISRKVMCQMAMLAYVSCTGSTPKVPSQHPFTDTTDPDIERAKAIGLVDGDGNGLFRPEESLTRQEFFCFVVKFLKAVGYPVSSELYGDLSGFTDAKSIENWAKEAVSVCVGLGVVKGNGSGLAPRDMTAAQEAILMFSRAYHLVEAVTPPNTIVPEKPQPNPDDQTFDHLFPNASSWAVAEITAMNDLGLIPTDVFGSSMKGGITRSDMCKMAVLAYKDFTNKPNLKPSKSSPFTDTTDTDIVLAAELGIVGGYSDGTFRPKLPMTREEYFKICTNLLGVLGYPKTDNTSVSLDSFSDASAMGNWAKPSARLLIGLGILKGSGGMLNPQADIVCEEAIALFYRCYQFMENYTPQEPPVVEKPPVTQPTPQLPAADRLAADLVAYACQFEGLPYIYGGQTPSGFDCSGLVYYVYGHFGFSLYRTADRQYYNGTPVKKSQLLPGDLVFFSSNGRSITHVGIYIGNNNIIHAANSRTGVVISSLTTNYYVNNYYGAVRIIKR